MAARWGAGEETLSIGGMELFTAGGPLQFHNLEEHDRCDGLSDLNLSSLDAEILGTFQGYLDNSIISIIDDNGAQAESKCRLDEDNELSLLAALTEILDNADDENISPFDSIPDSELLVSPKDRDGSALQKFLSLSRTPPDREISVEDQRRVSYAKVDVRCSGPNWDLFPDTLSSTPKRRTRLKNRRACLPRKAVTELTLQRSDGEEEEDHLIAKNFEDNDVSISHKDISMDAEELNEVDDELMVNRDTPCIINTENVALADLVKYMHPYCLPGITVCIDPEDEEKLLDEAVFLEVVPEQGETIKVPVIIKQAGDLLNYQSPEEDMPILKAIEDMDDKFQTLAAQNVPELNVNTEIISKIQGSELSEQSSELVKNRSMESMPILEKMSSEPVIAEAMADNVLDNPIQFEMNSSKEKESESNFKPNDKMEVRIPNPEKEKATLKGRKTSKNKQSGSLKSKSKSKNKGAKEEKPQEVQEMASSTLSATSRLSNPSLQESDLLIKILDQVKESQLELRSIKLTRSKARLRPSLENPEKKISNEDVKKEETITTLENGQTKSVVVSEVDVCSENIEIPKSSSVEPLLNDKTCCEDVAPVVSDSNSDSTSNMEVNQTEQSKEPKPKSLSLSEYRKRLQSRKPNPEKEHANSSSCSKWPSVPEPPTELAELPCLIPMPANANKTAVEEKQTPSKSENSSVQDILVNSNPPTVPVSSPANPNPTPAVSASSLTIHDALPHQHEEPCPAAMDTTPPPMMPLQPKIPPPFFPPAWPPVASHPPFYPGLPPLPAVPQFPNAMPAILPIQPPAQVINWPPFPPPPIAMGPLPPNSWVPAIPPPFWPSPQVPQGVPEPPIPFSATNPHVLPEKMPPPETSVPQVVCYNQMKQMKLERIRNLNKERKPRETLNRVNQDKSPGKNVSSSKPGRSISLAAKKSDVTLTPTNTEISGSLESKTAGPSVPDANAANQVVFKIMEILKKAQKFGFQINLPPQPVAQTPSGAQNPLEVTGVKPAGQKMTSIRDSHIQERCKSPKAKHEVATLIALKSFKDEVVTPTTVNKQTRAPTLTPVNQLCTKDEALNSKLVTSIQKTPAENLETGIEASDLTSLLEEFEKSEAKDDERLLPSPDKLAVGNSGPEKSVEKVPLDKHLAPELVNTAGLTPPATPPHQLWKTVSGNLKGKAKPLQGNETEKPCFSPVKTAKLIEPKPLPQSKLKNRNLGAAPSVTLPPVHVASGDHGYCIFSASRSEQETVAADNRVEAPNPSCQMEEGSRWNVKHHKNIIIKPILQFNKRPQINSCPAQTATNIPSAICHQSTTCGLSKPQMPCRNSQIDTNDPLDYRTNKIAEAAMKCPSGSVLMSPDASPCRSENGETRTLKENILGSRRSLRCYRKYRNSPSPQISPWRGRSSDSHSSSSSSSSSSRSRSRSPPSKRRRKSRSSSHRYHRSRSSSRSSYSSRSLSRSSSSSSSPSSRSCFPSSSRSRSRSRSPYRRRYRSRSRRCESRDSYYRQKMYHKEQAIEERRVVYIGKINNQMTRSELRRRFSVFGDIEECTIHFREHGDNYGFVTYHSTGQAFAAIENGHKVRLPDEMPFDLCFGGRRQFCLSTYADLDSNCDGFDSSPGRSKFERLDFDTLLKQAQKSLRR